MTVRLATWNLLHGRSLTDGAVCPATLAESVGLLAADVIAVQEADRLQPRSGNVDHTALIADTLGLPWWRYVPSLTGTPGVAWAATTAEDGSLLTRPSYGVGLASRYPVLDWQIRRFSPPPLTMPLIVPGRPGLTWLPDEPRVAVAAVIRFPGGPATVAAAHLSTVPGCNAWQLRRIVRWLGNLPAPRILLGDFNMPGPAAALATGWRRLVRARTYPSWRPLVQFDHVLASGLRRTDVANVDVRRLAVSDHCAITLDVSAHALAGREVEVLLPRSEAQSA